MNWIIKKSLQFRFLIVFLTILLVIFSVQKISEMPVDVFPEFAPPYVEIQTEGPGMSAEEIENLVTVQIENILRNIPGVDYVRSKSVQGLSSVRLIFDRGTDPLSIRQSVQEKLNALATNLPRSASITKVLQPLSSTSRVMKIGISSDKYSLMDLSMVSYWNIAQKLKQVPGVANIAIWGERWKMLTIQVDPLKLKEYNVSLDDVMESSSDSLDFGLLQYTPGAKTQSGGWIETESQRLIVNHEMTSVSTDELRSISIYNKKKKNGEALLLEDVADIVWTHQPLIGDAVINDGPGLLLIVEKFPWGNTLEVTKGVEKAIKEMRPGLKDIDIDTSIFRPATFIETSINNLTHAMFWGILFVVLVILIFLWDWRVALISIIVIPVSMVSALLILNFFGVTINVMVLAGLMIAIGAIVDDSIIDVENIIRRLRLLGTDDKKKISHTIFTSSIEVRSVIIYVSIIEVVSLIPIFFMDGLSGAFFLPLASSYVVATLVSMLIALTLTPALVMILLSNVSLKKKESPLVILLKNIYKDILLWTIKYSKKVYIFVIFILVVSIMIVPFTKHELLPSFKESDFLMHWLTKPGTSHSEMYRITQEVSKELRSIPGVRNFGAHIGRAIAADEVVGINFTENWISIEPTVDYNKTLALIQETVDGYPGLIRDVQTYLKERIREVLTGSGKAMIIRVYGPDLEELRKKAEEIKDNISGIDGLIDLHIEQQKEISQIQIKVDLIKAKKHGIKPGDVRRIAATLIVGTEVSDIHQNGKVYEVMVWSKPKIRNNVGSLKNLLIKTETGKYIKLNEIADVSINPTPNIIKRENNSRRIDIEANLGAGKLSDVAHEIKKVIEKIDLPTEYHIEFLGEFKEQQKAQNQIIFVGMFSMIGIFLLLQLVFGSWRLAVITFWALPLALSGGLIIAFITNGGILSLGSLVGFLTILGIAARNGVMLIKHYQHLEKEEGEVLGLDLIIRGTQERLTPILMTTFATGLALIPLVIAGNIPGHEIEYPMAIVILGGLFTSTMLNLFVLPSLYLKFGKNKK